MDPKMFRKRMYIPMVFAVFVVVIFIAKLFYLQIIHGNSYQELADRQYVTSSTESFDRGTIYFTQKDGTLVSAATLQSGYKLAVNGTLVSDPVALYNQIGSYVPNMTQAQFVDAVSKKTDSYIELATELTEDDAATISAMKLPAVSLYHNSWRFYPAGTLASHVIGFMGYQGNTYAGRYGLESSYDTVLQRTDQQLYVNFFAEVFSDINKLVTQPANEHEGDVVSTIEPTVQKNLETAVEGVKQKWNSDSAGGIIMDPNTGAIYAMALDDEFDLNNTKSVTDISQFNNPLVGNDYEMGSIMKPVIMSIALDQGDVTPDTTYFDQGFVKVKNRTIYNFDKRGRGLSTMQTVLNQSLNTGMVFVMQHMNMDTFHSQWLTFGFGQKTGIDLPGESTGLVSNLDGDNVVNYANASFGQGIAVTPVEMIRALAVLANGGHLVTPHLASAIQYPSGLTKTLDWPVTGQLIKPATDVTITKMLTTVFDNYDNGTIKLDHYSIAAKTGTAQIADPSGGYYSDRNLHTFMAYFPAQHPRFIVFMYDYYPKNGAKYSSDTLLPPFVDLAKFLISYYDLPPDR